MIKFHTEVLEIPLSKTLHSVFLYKEMVIVFTNPPTLRRR